MFLTEISVFLLILLISYRDFGILIDLVVYLTEYLGKIDQSLQTGVNGEHAAISEWKSKCLSMSF